MVRRVILIYQDETKREVLSHPAKGAGGEKEA